MAYMRWLLWWHLYVALGSHGGQWCMYRRSCRDNAAYDVTVPDKWGINTVRLSKLPSLAATARCSAVVATSAATTHDVDGASLAICAAF